MPRIRRPRLDASEGDTVIGDVVLLQQTREALRKRFVAGKFAWPSVVLCADGSNHSATYTFQP